MKPHKAPKNCSKQVKLSFYLLSTVSLALLSILASSASPRSFTSVKLEYGSKEWNGTYYNYNLVKNGQNRTKEVFYRHRGDIGYKFKVDLAKFMLKNFDLFIELTVYKNSSDIREMSVGALTDHISTETWNYGHRSIDWTITEKIPKMYGKSKILKSRRPRAGENKGELS